VARYRLHDHTGDDLGTIEHAAGNLEPGDIVFLPDGREALVTARVEAEAGALAACLRSWSRRSGSTPPDPRGLRYATDLFGVRGLLAEGRNIQGRSNERRPEMLKHRRIREAVRAERRLGTGKGRALCLVAALTATVALAAVAPVAASPKSVVAEVPVDFVAGGRVLLTTFDLTLEACPLTPFGACAAPRPPESGLLQFVVTPSDVGRTLWGDPSDPNFADFVTLITDGSLNLVSLHAPGAGLVGPEPGFFGTEVGPNGIDLHGYTISRIALRVDYLAIASPGTDPNGDGLWTDAALRGAFLFEGSLDKDACKDDGWQTMRRPDGSSFANQGDCISFANTNN
jgi:hypothetical protein